MFAVRVKEPIFLQNRLSRGTKRGGASNAATKSFHCAAFNPNERRSAGSNDPYTSLIVLPLVRKRSFASHALRFRSSSERGSAARLLLAELGRVPRP